MKTKHTSGIWKTTSEGFDRFVYSENHGAICTLPISYGKERTNEGEQESEANARLIASAPELLNALKVIAIWYQTPSEVRPTFPYEQFEAISKAEGKTVNA